MEDNKTEEKETKNKHTIVPINRGKCMLVISYVKNWLNDVSANDSLNKEDSIEVDNDYSFNNDRSSKMDRSSHFSDSFLENLDSLVDPLFIINKLEIDKEIFINLLKSRPTLYQIHSIFSVLNRLFSSGYKKHLLEILSRTLEADFLEHLDNMFQKMDANIYLEYEELLETFIDNITKYFEVVVDLIPTLVQENLIKLIITFQEFLKRLLATCNDSNLEFLKEIYERITVINETLSDRPKDDILIVYPVEFMRTGHISKNIVHGPYKNVKHYVDTQFRLLKEDFEESLRSGVKLYKDQIECNSEKIRNTDVDVYKDVSIKVNESARNNGYILTFHDTSQIKTINWVQSKKFMIGSLLLLSNDNFRSYYFATVRDRYFLVKGRNCIRISFIGNPPSSLKNQSFVLLESTNFFEPYFQVLSALLNMSEINFPMYKYIINADTKAKLPAYVSPNSVYEICGTQIKICDINDWPSANKLNLNDSQMHALRIALTSEFTLIQGPPGTGKTYLCLQIIETLLNNVGPSRGSQQSPILVVCYKNHALDQILESLLQRKVKVLRLGGQSKNVELKEKYNVNSICKNTRAQGIKYILRKLKLLDSSMINRQQKIVRYYKKMAPLEDSRGIIGIHAIESVINPSVYESIVNTRKGLVKWLFNDIANDIDIDIIIELCFIHKQKIDKGDLVVVDCPPIPENGLNFDILNECDHFKESCPESSTYSLSLYDLEITMKVLREYIYVLCSDQLEMNNLNDIVSQVQLFKDCLTFYQHLKKRLASDTISTNSVDMNTLGDIHELTSEQRWQLFNYWKDKYHRYCEQQINQLQEEHDRFKAMFEEINDIKKVKKIQKYGAQVVGATTTAAARCHRLLTELKPKIVILEEAAEVLEAHAVVSLSKHCQHVILIGDHKQLRPSPYSYRLAENFHLNVSLFERMIRNNLYAPVLTLQHRMRPEISALITPSIYKKLDNHFTVLNYPNIMGIKKNLFFINHNIPEDSVTNSLSRMNKFEGDLLIQLCIYLLHNGYQPEEITILSTYVAQNEYILAESQRLELPAGLRITVVDNFQGEENRVILLSLVRCNENASIGFLSVENRVCVALSRAKEGLFITGSMSSLVSKSKLWREINRGLMRNSSIGKSLPLVCKAHQNISNISSAEDISKVIANGCGSICNIRINCGHICSQKCHALDFNHELEFRCKEDCYRRCQNGHPCKAYCGDTCPPCTELIDHTLECGHIVQIPCHQLNEQSSDEETDTLDECTKALRLLTLSNTEEDDNTQIVYKAPQCQQPCNFLLSCGHNCVRKCHKDDREHANYICNEKCTLINKNCSFGHKCERKCSEECGDCIKRIKKKLSCGHTVQKECYICPEVIKCTEKCTKILDCGHRCKLMCASPCGKCETSVTKVIDKCKHKINVKCSEYASQSLCTKICGLVLKCGHRCKGKCSVPCENYVCKVPLSIISRVCGHDMKIPCHLMKKSGEMNWKDVFSSNCTKPCRSVLGCGHICQGTCGQCVNGRLHTKCIKKCFFKMLCGHNCSSRCSDAVHLCNKPCQRICDHCKCQDVCGVSCQKKCQQRCRRKCDHFRCEKKCWEECNEKCTRDCPLKLPCGHPCRGICGQKCPNVCLECGSLPSGDNSSSRYIVLDCGHSVNINVITSKITSKNSVKEVGVLKCPKCRSPVFKTNYFKEEVNATLLHFSSIKKFLSKNINNEELRTKFSDIIKTLQHEVNSISDYPEIIEMMQLIKKSTIPFIVGANKNDDCNKIRSTFFVINYVTILVKYYKRINFNYLPKFEQNLIKIRFDLILAKLNERLIIDLSNEQTLQFRIELIKLISIIEMYNNIIEKCETLNRSFTDVKLLQKYTDDVNDTIFTESKLINNTNCDLNEMNAIVSGNIEVNFCLPTGFNRTMHVRDWSICDKDHIFRSSFTNCPQCKIDK
ncbi:hypothetical protein O3M35_008250 [Rhynocoris fuscipes]|uniref:C2H2-type domain-containing protein n=1 Tax=Rhynocoris fuscipes TaxID=488301 RepID=A0AAW1D8A1_9HEMI